MKDRLINFIKRFKFQVFLGSVIAISLVLVNISMNLYYSTNAYQLDLSRPEYVKVRSQIEKDPKDEDSFSEQGPVNQETLEDFLNRFQAEERKAIDSKAFQNDVLGDEQLGIENSNNQ